jgi:hypothetical protein
MRVSVAALVLAFTFTAPLLSDAAQARQTSVRITKVSTVSYLTVPDDAWLFGVGSYKGSLKP